ncbi:MAG TPA: ABC transporter permease [Bacteroidales bacterium]|nr:ABC transporter permease [Bacteroidales bacterium]HPE57604.1 ABC transporter permease [Bacteroidales bacterium]HRX96187.1 ABC transporter permease [Bacteroidales bacterium]
MLILKLINESFIFALQAIVANKVRTFLSLLGITIGIFLVIAVLTIFDSMEIAIRNSIQQLGSNVLFIQKWPWGGGGGEYPWWKYMKRPEPKLQDLREIQRRSLASEASAFMFEVRRTVKYGSNSMDNISILGVSHDFDQVMPFDIAEGRYFTLQESQSGGNVAIIGANVAENLFGGLPALGREIKIFGNKVLVIGITKKEGEDMFGSSSDYQVKLPVNFARRYIDLESVGTTVLVKAKPNVSNEELKDEMVGIMRSVRKLKPKAEDDFAINETDIISREFDAFFGAIAAIGWFVGGFSLLVGGFGIANIMFVSVKERTNQIGIQMSLGAKKFFILLQFLFEAVFLSLFGGIIGLLIIYLLVLLSQAFPFQLVLTFSNIVLGTSVSILIGLIAGIVPSYGASRLDPVEAMRSNF